MITASANLIKGATGDWQVVIGMEVHAQVTSESKLFSGASTEFGGAPNSHVSLVDAAMPGMLPVINEVCIAQAVRTGLGLKATINPRSVFDRKNYFYPDLPQGYQISQYKSPIVGEGKVTIVMPYGERFIGIERLHLEQDAGKSLHDRHSDMSAIDLNRSGVALMEIVSKPDLRSANEAKAFLLKVRSVLRYLGTCDGDMEKGSLRADVNVSVRRAGETKFGTRCEIKNMNSISFIGDAIDHEARRQIEIIEDGGTIDQETRLYDANKRVTRSMRSKEEAHDYRYFPDPDLLPLELDIAYVKELEKQLPELPDDKLARFEGAFELSPDRAERLTLDRDLADKFEDQVYRYVSLVHGPEGERIFRKGYGLENLKIKEDKRLEFLHNLEAAEQYYYTAAEGADKLANMVLGDVLAKCNEVGANPADHIDRLNLPEFVRLITDGTISGKIAKDLFEIVWQEGGDPRALVEARGMKQVTDLGAIEKAVDEIIAANPDKAAQARAKPQLVGWFVGQVMKSSGGKANPQSVNDLLKAKLGI
jgi:aspartyl-tRNA(Asn)/glutamyl-tRNA(Gln) amidotransferase subunit B